MTCENARAWIAAEQDGELDAADQRALAEHLAGCRACAAERERLRALSSALRASVPYRRAPMALRARVVRAVREAAAPAQPARAAVRPWRWAGAAAAAALIVLAGADVALRWGNAGESTLASQVVDGHVRSMMAHHLTDVASTDQHTVKPWFDGRLDFAPPVADFAAAGFPLVGGRLEYLAGHPVAALVYGRRLHMINLFLWPERGAGDAEAAPISRRGYQVIHGRVDGFAFWAVSDLNVAELRSFVALVRGGGRPGRPGSARP